MLELTIDEKQVEVEEGTTILEAARKVGVEIPTLCHDERLRPYGACRMCLVETEGNPKLLPACTTPATNGMVVRTTNERLRKVRKMLIEMQTLHHPLDCPICDAAGACQLQDMVYALGVDVNRFKGERRHVPYDSRSPLIERNTNRCILCGKCVRICDEVQGVGAINVSYRGFETDVGPPFGEALDCEFCGQCWAVCPVGALNSRLAKFKGRSWVLEHTPTVCPYCGTGCSFDLEVHPTTKEVVRVEARAGVGVNNANLCGKGRFGYEFIHSADRLKEPLVKRNGKLEPATWDEAIAFVAHRLQEIGRAHGPDSIGGLGSGRCTNEENYLFQRFMRQVIGTNNIDSCARLGHVEWLEGMKQACGTFAIGGEIGTAARADAILVVESNITETNPVLSLDVLRAARFGGAQLMVLNSRASKITHYSHYWLRCRPGTSVAVLNAMTNAALGGSGEGVGGRVAMEGLDALRAQVAEYTPAGVADVVGVDADEIADAARAFAEAKSGLIILSLGMAENTKGLDTVLAAANLAMATGNVRPDFVGLMMAAELCNIQGACDMGVLPEYYPGYVPVTSADGVKGFEEAWGCQLPRERGMTADKMWEALDAGTLKALYVMGENPAFNFPDSVRVRKALEKAELLVVQDLFLSETAELADVVLPAATWAEKNGTFTNTERRVQRVRRSLKPIAGSRPDMDIIEVLASAMGRPLRLETPAAVLEEIEAAVPAYREVAPREDNGLGRVWSDSFERVRLAAQPVGYRPPDETVDEAYPFWLITGNSLFHSGTLSRNSEGIYEAHATAELEINPRDAEQCGLVDGDRVIVRSRRGELTLEVMVSEASVEGSVFVPNHFRETPVNVLMTRSRDGGPAVCPVQLEKVS